MSIVYVDRHLVGQIVDSAVDCHVVADNALDGCGNEEVLLSESEQLTLHVVVGGIEHL